MKIKIINTENDEVLYEGANAFCTYGEGTMQKHIRPEGSVMLDEKYKINQGYVDVINKLVKKYSEYIGHVIPSKILCRIDMSWELKETTTVNTQWEIDIKRATKDQQLYTGADYILNLKQWWLEHWDDAQIVAAIFSQLMRIDSDTGAVIKYRETKTTPMTSTFGKGYLEEHVSIPNMLEEKIQLKDYRRADYQTTMFDQQEEGENEEQQYN